MKLPARISLLALVLIASAFVASTATRPELFFTKRNAISYKLTSENGAISYSTVEIKDVTTTGERTSIYAHDNRSDDQHKSTFSYRLHFQHDSYNWCEDALNYLNCNVVYSSNFLPPVLTTDSLVFPYGMKVGDTLAPASASETIVYGATSTVRKIEFVQRKVTGTDSIPYNSRNVLAYRIECQCTLTTIADYGQLGKIPTELKYGFTEWFAPQFGVMKTRSKTTTGQSTRVMQFTP